MGVEGEGKVGGEMVRGGVAGGGMAVGQLERSRKRVCGGISVTLRPNGVSKVPCVRQVIHQHTVVPLYSRREGSVLIVRCPYFRS